MSTRFIKVDSKNEMDVVDDSDDTVEVKPRAGIAKDIESDPEKQAGKNGIVKGDAGKGPSLLDRDDDDKPSACAYCVHRNPNIAFGTMVLFISTVCILPLEMVNIAQRDKGFWIDLYGSEDVGDAEWCEAADADLTQFIIEPSNARSDYVFVVWGAFLIVLGLFDVRSLLQRKASAELEEKKEVEDLEKEVSVPNPLLRYPHITYFNGLFNLLYGLGSFWNHACECSSGSRAAISGMMAVSVFPLLYTPVQILVTSSSYGNSPNFSAGFLQALSTLPPIGQITFFCLVWYDVVPTMLMFSVVLGCTVGVVTVVLVYLYYWKNKRAHEETASCGRPPRPKLRHRLVWWLFPIGLACFGIGFWAWQMDKLKVWCYQEGFLKVLQGHAVWHLLTAVSLICAYWMYRSEELTLVPPQSAVAEGIYPIPSIERVDTGNRALASVAEDPTLTGKSVYLDKFKGKNMPAPSNISDDSSDSGDSIISDFLTGLGCPADHRPYLI